MQAIIVYKRREESIPHRLNSGETVLEHQIRMLGNVGIRSIILVANPAEMDCVRKETDHSYFSDYQFFYAEQEREGTALAAAEGYLTEEDTFVVYEDLLFDADLLNAMLSSEHVACTVIDKAGDRTAMCAKMGMKDVEKVGQAFSGIGCFCLIPLFFLRAESLAMWRDAAKEASDWEALNNVLPQMHMRTLQAKDFTLGRFSGQEWVDCELLYKQQQKHYTDQQIVHGAGSILEIKNLLDAFGVKNPLLVCDDSYQNLQIETVFAHFDIHPFVLPVKAAITQEQAQSAAKFFADKAHDGIVSVGGNDVINAAKAIKLFCAEKNGDVLFSPIAHIAIPTVVLAGAETHASVSVLKEGQPIAASYDCLLPDAVIADGNLLIETEEDLRAEDCFAAASLATNSMWNRYATKKSAKLASHALQLLNRNKKKYLLDGEAKGGIAWAINQAARAAQLVELNKQYQQKAALYERPEEEENEEDDILVEDAEAEEVAVERTHWANSILSRAASYTKDSLNTAPKKKKKGSGKKGLRARIIRFVKSRLPKVYKKFKHIRSNLLFHWFGFKHGLDTQMVLFESAHGSKCNCNPRAIYEAMLQDPEYLGFTFVWALKKPKDFPELSKNPRTILVAQGSDAYIRRCAQAKYWVSNYNMPSYLRKGKDHVWIHTWHGKPIKRIGCDFNNTIRKDYAARDIKRNYTGAARQMTYLLSAAPAFSKHMANAYNLPALKKEHIVAETGYPRNDFLFTYTPEDVIRLKFNLGIPLDKKVILYTPTWRVVNSTDSSEGFVYKSHLDLGAFSEALGEDYVILFRAHPYEAKSVDFSTLGSNVLNTCDYPEVNDLYIISDLMISDYSGTIFDYANLRRPMVYYMYDRDEYVNEQTGVYFDLDTLPGPIVYKEEDLAQTVKEHLANFVYDEKYQQFNHTYNLLDGPNCGRDTAHMLIPKTAAKSMSKQRKDKLREGLQNFRVRVTGLFRGLGISRNPNTRAFAAYKDKYKGERCFMVGNGPSLTLTDLDNIKNEYSFCCNLIYKIFDLTQWRPSFYCITDLVFTSTIAKELSENITVPFFTTKRSYKALKVKPEQSLYVNSVKKDDYHVHGNMKQYYIPANATVMTFMIELAMYMGFKEIYLIGVDCSNGFVGKDSHFIEDYENDAMMQIEYKRAGRALGNKHLTLEEFGKYRTDRAMFAYAKLRKYADKHGIKIYNATRGGYLEEFERANLDDLEFKGE